jgi:tetratricopeptide (TPR) repeat protein
MKGQSALFMARRAARNRAKPESPGGAAELLAKGVRLHRAGELKKARAVYGAILRHNPHNSDAHHLLGLVDLAENRTEAAIGHIKKAIETTPFVAAYHAHLAEAYQKIGDHRNAESECHLALRMDPKLTKAHNLLGLIRMNARDLEGAVESFSAAIGSTPAGEPSLEGMLNLSAVLNRLGQHDLAARYAGLVLSLDPDNPLAWTNLGMARRAMGQREQAKEAFCRAGDSPMARFNLGYSLLLENDLAHGLPLCEERKRIQRTGRNLTIPEWDGSPMPNARIVVIPEQGLGDTILMSRFFSVLRERFAGVTALVKPPLVRLIRTCDPGLDVVTDQQDVLADVWCATMSLPVLLGIDSVEKIPTEPWLHVPGAGRSGRGAGKPRVGINWAGNPLFAYDAMRSAHLEDLSLLLDVKDVEWCSIHKGHLEHEADARGLPQPLKDARDFFDTAVVLCACDLVISTETAVPNLSCALGIPTCVLTGPDPDWRWGAWFPTATVCAQDAPGNWYASIARALEEIRGILIRQGGDREQS